MTAYRIGTLVIETEGREFAKSIKNIKKSILETNFFSLLLEWAYTVNNKNMVLLYRIVRVGAVHKLCRLGRRRFTI